MPLGLGLCGSCCTPTVCGDMKVTITGCFLNGAPNPGFHYPGAILTVKQGATVVGTAAAIDQVTALTRTAIGSGYTSVPTVTISGDGTGATAIAVLTTSSVTAVTLSSGGSGYITAPTVTITGTSIPGNDAAATARLGPSAVASLTLASAGSGYTNGTGYALGFSGGAGSGATGTFDVVSGTVTNLVLTAGGANYTTAPTLSFPGAGSGSGAAGTAGLTPGPVTTLTLVGGGSGYTPSGATLTISAPPAGGTTATGTATIGTFQVNSFTITNAGSGYTTATLAVTGGGGSGAAGTVKCAAQATVPLPAAGTYTPIVSGAADTRGSRFVTQTLANQTLAACNGASINIGSGTTPVILLAVSGYHCCPGSAIGCGPYPDTLFLTDANGTHTLLYTAVASGSWQVSYNVSLANTLLGAGGCGTGTVSILYNLTCTAGGPAGTNYRLRLTWQLPSACGAFGSGACPDFSEDSAGIGATTYDLFMGPSTCQQVLSLSGTLPASKPRGSISVNCTTPPTNLLLPVSGGITISE
jgi:hypothetical protein